MYGVNTVIENQNPQLGTSSYTAYKGISLGGGIDICLFRSKVILSTAIFHAFRDYDYLMENYQVGKYDFEPMLLSFGIKYGIN